jgi:hypothetical protein
MKLNKKAIHTFTYFAVCMVFLAGCAEKGPPISSNTASLAQSSSISSESSKNYAQEDVVPDISAQSYPDFFAVGSPAFMIPGLKEDLVPQGMCAIPSENVVVVSYYLESKQNSMLAVVDTSSGKMIKAVKLVNEDGTPYTGHAGGLAASNQNLWVVTGGDAQRIQISDLMKAEPMAEVRFVDRFRTCTRASLANCIDGVLWVGDFYTAGGDYETDEAHHMTAPDGNKNYAWIAGYKLDSTTENELNPANYTNSSTPAVPDFILSVPDKIQGFTRLKSGEFVLSESYGRKNDSHILIHKDVLKSEANIKAEINGIKVPLWFLDSNTQVKSITAPPMAESIENVNNQIYVLFESGSNLYRSNAVNPMDEVYRLTNPLNAK